MKTFAEKIIGVFQKMSNGANLYPRDLGTFKHPHINEIADECVRRGSAKKDATTRGFIYEFEDGSFLVTGPQKISSFEVAKNKKAADEIAGAILYT